jgi:ABC-type branched-subunit amino acid transport system substrate-binding protein
MSPPPGGSRKRFSKLRLLLLGVTAALSVLAVACGGDEAEVPGVTDSEIVLGQHTPLSGSYAAVYEPIASAQRAYFDYVNSQGGVCGRSIDLRVEDDMYDPARTLDVTKKLVEQDKVLAIVGGLGTAPHSAVYEYLNRNGVPDLFVSSGARKWGSDPERFPYTIGFIIDYTSEGAIIGKYISANFPGQKVGVLYQNDDFGKDGLAGLKATLDPQKSELAVTQSYEPSDTDIRSQAINLRDAGAEVVVAYSLPGFSAQLISGANRMGWKPQIILSYVNTDPVMFEYVPPEVMEGVLATGYLTPPDRTGDPAIARHRQIMADHDGPQPSNYSLYGQALAETVVKVLSDTCGDLTREGLMRAAESLRGFHPSVLLEGIDVNLSPSDHYAVQALQMHRAVGGRWEPFGDIVSLD